MANKTSDLKVDPQNEQLFNTFVPKIEKYRKALQNGILEEYKLPDDAIPKEYGKDVTKIPERFLNEKEREITDLRAVDLAAAIAAGDYSAVEVFKAYAKRATMAHQLTNCAMELFMDIGLARARELDEFRATTGKTVGRLHGVPVSLKEHFDYKGRITHAGYVGLIDHISDETNTCAQILYDAGAVFYIRTTEPQMLMHFCSNNNITGLAKNPFNTALSTGGSSSGEGAMAAMKGSAFGVGSDLGGSIRCPAAFCGVWGLKPTQKRVPLTPFTPAGDRVQENVASSLGPLARSAADLDLFMQVQLEAKPWEKDATLIPLPWRDVAIPHPSHLKVAICYDDGVVKPTPPIIRGLQTAARKLVAAGVRVVEWESFNVAELVDACYRSYNADGNAGYVSLLKSSGEPLLKLSKFELNQGCGFEAQSVADYERSAGLRDFNRNAYLQKMRELDVDFILSPAYTSVAPVQETPHYWGYCNLWNILDFPNVVFPTGLVCDAKLDHLDLNACEARNETERYERGVFSDASLFEGAPICLQLTGKRWRDEELVKASALVEDIVSA